MQVLSGEEDGMQAQLVNQARVCQELCALCVPFTGDITKHFLKESGTLETPDTICGCSVSMRWVLLASSLHTIK